MKVIVFEELPSTHLFLAEKIKNQEILPPVLVLTHHQSNGIGSRGNVWNEVKKGLYFSFALYEEDLPEDLALESVSIYFGYIFKEVLAKNGSKVCLKWPNDLYLGQKKIGGILCTKIKNVILVGIGLNLNVECSEFGDLDIEISREEIINDFIKEIKKYTWKQIFSKYKLEFFQNFNYSFHHKGKLISLKEAQLLEDGSILLKGERIYSLR